VQSKKKGIAGNKKTPKENRLQHARSGRAASINRKIRMGKEKLLSAFGR